MELGLYITKVKLTQFRENLRKIEREKPKEKEFSLVTQECPQVFSNRRMFELEDHGVKD